MTKEEQVFALIQEAEQSNQTTSAFCASRDIRMKTFFYWRRKFLAVHSAATRFIPIAAPAVVENTVRLSYPNGVQIHLSVADVSLIAQLIRWSDVQPEFLRTVFYYTVSILVCIRAEPK